MNWVVVKYGGTSVANAACWQEIARNVQSHLIKSSKVWIVVSALSQVSNTLERVIAEALEGEVKSLESVFEQHWQLCRDLGLDTNDSESSPTAGLRALMSQLANILTGVTMTREVSCRLRARIMSFGEVMSSEIGHSFLSSRGTDVQLVNSTKLLKCEWNLDEQIEERFLNCKVLPSSKVGECEKEASGHSVVISQGFIASNPDGETCLLGRGGSDTSAALYGAMLKAHLIEIWTDVYGLFSSDPRIVPSARLIASIGYREAQELAAMGAKVLHPRSIAPAASANVPIVIRNTNDPSVAGTKICAQTSMRSPAVVYAVVQRKNVVNLTISTLDMLGQAGFLARVFRPFEDLQISVDMVATSQSSVSVTLDYIPGGVSGEAFRSLLNKLGALGSVEVNEDCTVVSIVGHHLKSIIHKLGPAMSVLSDVKVLMLSESTDDLNLSFVVYSGDAEKVLTRLHSKLVPLQYAGDENQYLQTWESLNKSSGNREAATDKRWWIDRRDDLLKLAQEKTAEDGSRWSCFVYDLNTVASQAANLMTHLTAVGQKYFAIKSNPHPEFLKTVSQHGFGMECVSKEEVELVRNILGPNQPILFTPNFCCVNEYQFAFDQGAEVTIDGPAVIEQSPQTFQSRSVAVRLDPGDALGRGHCGKVVTAGAQQKFGHPIYEIPHLMDLCKKHNVKVTGMHAHVGSGVMDPANWQRIASLLQTVATEFPDLEWIDIGGGLGVVERFGQSPLDLAKTNSLLQPIAEALSPIQLRMEPGRYLTSEAGVLVAPVTQIRQKGQIRFVGLSTGMNSLIRPSLYGAYHNIHNLSHFGDNTDGYYHIVGPICETGDILGKDRPLPSTQPGDIMLIENCGAYGRVMSSSYNSRAPAEEVVLEQ